MAHYATNISSSARATPAKADASQRPTHYTSGGGITTQQPKENSNNPKTSVEMKFLTVLVVLMMTMYGVQAFLPKFPKLVMKYEDSDEEASPGFPLFKFRKLGLFEDKLEKKKEKKEDFLEALLNKDTLIEKLTDKSESKFEDRLLGFFDDKTKARTVYDKLQAYKFDQPAERGEPEKSCPCKERSYDNCDDEIRYFS